MDSLILTCLKNIERSIIRFLPYFDILRLPEKRFVMAYYDNNYSAANQSIYQYHQAYDYNDYSIGRVV
ncbi:MAG: hypothetical protein IKH45_04455, partial [Neisseriaceae bacterium]|nr:hypothetical protein [Neisseriaceae bacterium]